MQISGGAYICTGAFSCQYGRVPSLSGRSSELEIHFNPNQAIFKTSSSLQANQKKKYRVESRACEGETATKKRAKQLLIRCGVYKGRIRERNNNFENGLIMHPENKNGTPQVPKHQKNGTPQIPKLRHPTGAKKYTPQVPLFSTARILRTGDF